MCEPHGSGRQSLQQWADGAVFVRSLEDMLSTDVNRCDTKALNTTILLLSDIGFKEKIKNVQLNVDIILSIVVFATAVNSSEAP